MKSQLFADMLLRDLQKVKEEVSAYQEDSDLWAIPDGVKNSGGTLALHLAGNIRHFIGHLLGKTGYKRQRDLEFSARNISREDILSDLEQAMQVVKETLPLWDESALESTYPSDVFGANRSVEDILLVLTTHLSYHLGQLNYHHRIVSSH